MAVALTLASTACLPSVSERVALPVSDVIEADCTPQTAQELVRASSVQVGTTFVRGTAFHVGDGVYVTAAHVLAWPSVPHLRWGARDYLARVLYVDEQVDVAVVESELVIPNALRFAETLPTEGDQAWSFGFSGKGGVAREFEYRPPEEIARIGSVEADYRRLTGQGFEDVLLFSGRADPGDSGSAVVSVCGEVLAVLTNVANPYLSEGWLSGGTSAEAATGVLQIARGGRSP